MILELSDEALPGLIALLNWVTLRKSCLSCSVVVADDAERVVDQSEVVLQPLRTSQCAFPELCWLETVPQMPDVRIDLWELNDFF
ncbi:hypothetical protein HDF11_002025 [Tunturiibacter psychrotolerans]